MMTKRVEKPGDAQVPKPEARPVQHHPDVVRQQHPKGIGEMEKIKTPATIAELKALIAGGGDPGSVLLDPRLPKAINGLHEWQAAGFGRALLFYPTDVRVFLSHLESIRKGHSLNPSDSLKRSIADGKDFAFCVHPYTEMALTDDVEVGHPETMQNAGVLGGMQDRFTVGMVTLKQGLPGANPEFEILVTKTSLIPSLSPDEACLITQRILTEMGLPAEAKLAKPRMGRVEAIILKRGFTPGGKSIPQWDKGDHTKGVLFEGKWCYTSFPVPSPDGTIHARGAATIARMTGSESYDVFNTLEGTKGRFCGSDLPNIADGRDKNVSGPDRRFIVRAETTQPGQIPSVFTSIERAFESRTLHEGRGGSD
ncbi:MAG: hypothetical protein V1703_04430 [Candidatus Altiarchaeota archaeon]